MVEDVMTRKPRCCRPEDDLATAAQVMWDVDCGCVPIVVDGRHIVGMITDRDVCMAALMNGRPLHEVRVEHVMTKNIATCKSTDDVREAQRIMRRRKVRRLPVTDAEGKLVGILSLHDVASTAKRNMRRLLPKVRLREVGLTFAEVSERPPSPAPPKIAPNVAYAE